MAKENKRYYWLKFKEDFFTSKRIKKLRKLGADYLIIYLKMQLKALKNNGYLEITGLEKNIADEIALDIDEDEDKVQITLSYLQACGLVEVENDTLFLPYVQENTGSETASTIRSRECRNNQKVLQCNTDATPLQHQCNTEIDIEIDKEIDIDIDKELDKNNSLNINNNISTQKPKKEPKHKYGDYKHVQLTDSERERLINDYGEDAVHDGIKYLDEYIQMTGKKYKDHNLVLRKWGIEGAKKKNPTRPQHSVMDEWANA